MFLSEDRVTRLHDLATRTMTYSLQRDSPVEVNETRLEDLDLRAAVTVHDPVCSLLDLYKRGCDIISSHSTQP